MASIIDLEKRELRGRVRERLAALSDRVEALEKLLDEKRGAVVSSADGA